MVQFLLAAPTTALNIALAKRAMLGASRQSEIGVYWLLRVNERILPAWWHS
jgi:hypothetical protein